MIRCKVTPQSFSDSEESGEDLEVLTSELEPYQDKLLATDGKTDGTEVGLSRLCSALF